MMIACACLLALSTGGGAPVLPATAPPAGTTVAGVVSSSDETGPETRRDAGPGAPAAERGTDPRTIDPAKAHVRAASARARDTLTAALSRSAIVRGLVARLNVLDAIVFVDARVDPALPTAETLLVTTTPSVRYLRVVLNPALPEDERIELLGHELQHAIEIASAPGVVDAASFRRHYRAIGRELGPTGKDEHAFETEAAKAVQALIRRELASRPARSASGARAPR